MSEVTAGELPPAALLHSYRAAGAFTDCYAIDVNAMVTQAAFVEAFYTTRLFKLERFLIGWLAGRPSTDHDATALATGRRDDFAMWTVEQRLADQLLLADASGRTRSWLMVVPLALGRAGPVTRLCFGSALVPRIDRRTGERRFGALVQPLMGFHRAYSRALLGAAATKLSLT